MVIKLGISRLKLLVIISILFSIAASVIADPAEARPRPRTVVVVPHCDDEAIFAGEVLTALARTNRSSTSIVFTTDCSGPPAYDAENPNYGADRYAFARSQLQGMGFTDIRNLGGDSSYNGQTVEQKTDQVTSLLRSTGLIRKWDEVWVISNTGHIDHLAAYRATARLGREAHLPSLNVYWAYDDSGLIYTPREGTPITSYATAENIAGKNAQLLGYYNFFANNYPEAQESLLTARKNAHDVLSKVTSY